MDKSTGSPTKEESKKETNIQESENGLDTEKKPATTIDDKKERSSTRKIGRDTSSNDPDSVRCRMFIGNLNTENMGREDLEKHFAQYGKVIGCSIHTNFGFVQYSSREEADKAVAATHGSTVFGKRVDANIASERRRPAGKNKKRERSPTSRNDGGRMYNQEGFREPPVRYRSRSPVSRYDELYEKNDSFGRSGRLSPRDYQKDRRPGEYSKKSGTIPSLLDPYLRDTYDESSSSRPRGSTDCEIIATAPDVRSYGDTIETRLHAMGISARIMFPPPDVSISSIIDRLARGGCLYAVVVSSQNEFHQSCTLNILHGAPQEHRNMPLDDALAFVARNFNHYLNDLKERPAIPWSAPSTFSKRDEFTGKTILTQDSYISGLLNLAAAGKPLKVVEVNHLIEAFIKYKNDIGSVQAGETGKMPQSTYDSGERKTASSNFHSLHSPSDVPSSAGSYSGYYSHGSSLSSAASSAPVTYSTYATYATSARDEPYQKNATVYGYRS